MLCPSKASAAVKKPKSPVFNKGDIEAKTISETIFAVCYFSTSAMPITVTHPFFPSTPKKKPPHKKPTKHPYCISKAVELLTNKLLARLNLHHLLG